MSDNTALRGKADRIRINIKQRHERSYWAKRLHISHMELERVVRIVGPMVVDVKRFMIDRITNA